MWRGCPGQGGEKIMIYFSAADGTFNLVLARSYYAFRIGEEGRLQHLAWGVRPACPPEAAQLSGQAGYELSGMDTDCQMWRDELAAFGDLTYHEVDLKVSFPSLPAQMLPGEAPHLPVRDVRLRYAGHEVVQDGEPGLAPRHGQPVRDASPRETLRVRLVDPIQPFEVVLCYRLTPEDDILERWCELFNPGTQPVDVAVCGFATLHLPNGTTELTSVAGHHEREFITQRERLPIGLRIVEHRTLQTGHQSNPFFFLNRPGQAWEESGTVYFGALAYSGSWRLNFEHLPSLDVRVHAGYNPFDSAFRLAPGERHVTPALVAGVCPDGWGGASARLHALTAERILPRPEAAPTLRPVLYNSWEATYFDLNEANQLELARKAAAIGVELFCVDDGWFGGRRNEHAGLGDWTVSPEVFPRGLEPLIAEIHGLGMQFGLWVEPEMVNADSELYRRHPDWVLHFPGRPRTEARNQLMLDFGRPEVVEHVYELLNRLLCDYRIDFIKWDMNRYVSEPGSVAGQSIWRAHTAAVYSIIDRLRREHPALQIESCSGGGGRVDLGILGRVDQVWTSDNTDPFHRLHIQEGFSLAYPARVMEAWVTHAQNHQTGRVTPLSFRFDVAMRGALGIGSSLNRLDDAELAEYARYIAFYKRIRHVIQEGRLYRLQRLEEFGASVVEYLSPDAREAVYSLAVHEHYSNSFRPSAPLRGLDPLASYVAVDVNGQEVHRAGGYELMTVGLPGEAGRWLGYSRTLHLRQE